MGQSTVTRPGAETLGLRHPEPAGQDGEAPVAEVERACAAAMLALDAEDAASARAEAERAVLLARRMRLPKLEGRARLVYGRCLGFSGSPRAGLRQIDRAERLLEGSDLGEALLQRSALLYKMGDPIGTLEACDRVLEVVPPEAVSERARAFNNIGIVRLYTGPMEQARAALAEAERLHRLAGRPAQAAQTRANLAMALHRLGDLVGALRTFEEAEREALAHGVLGGQILFAKAEVLLAAGLLRDVKRDLPDLIADLDARSMHVDAAEGCLYLALALVGLGDPRMIEAAGEARERFRQAGCPGWWEALAGLVEVRARWVGGDVSLDALRAARRTLAQVQRRGLPFYEAEAELQCGVLAAALGRQAEACRRFEAVAAQRRRGSVRQRALGWEGLARLRVLAGNRSGALRAADAGLRVVEGHRDAIGATDLRAGASFQGVELAALALREAVAGGNPVAVLRWAERWRAGALYRRPVFSPSDPAVADLLSELRRTTSAMRVEAAVGQPTRDLERRLGRLERALADWVRHNATAADRDLGRHLRSGLDLDELRASLGSRVLVEYIECDGELMTVVLDDRRCILHRLGPTDAVAARSEATLFALRKLTRLTRRSPAAGPSLAAFSGRVGALRAALLGAPLPFGADRELVVVPTGHLHVVPWQLLAGSDRTVAVAPSAALWQEAARSARFDGDVVGVAGPGLAGAMKEMMSIRAHHPHARTLTGAAATVYAVSSAIDGARLVHLAAHGDIRSDNPLFSSFRMADGPQTVYDLQCLTKAPATVVLSACNSALSQVDAGDELLGLVASLLAGGTSTAVAAVLPVPDLAAVPLMDRLHRGLAAGDRPGAALAAAAAGADPDDPAAVAAGAAFVCLGAA